MRQLERVVAILPAVAVVAVAGAGGAFAQVDGALRAIDDGDPATARAPLAAEVARWSYYQALAEEGEARRSAAERARVTAAPGSWVAAAASALLAELDGDDAGALAGYRDALALAPGDARLWYRFGVTAERAGERAEARDAYGRATALDPAHRTALIALGGLLRADGDFAAAYNAYNHAIDDKREPVEALLGRAAARLYIGDAEGAVADARRAAELAPAGGDRHRALMAEVWVRTFQRRLPEGIDRAEEAATMWAALGRADMVAATLNATARALLETADPASADAWYDRGWQAIEASAMPAGERTIWEVRWRHGKARAAAARRRLDEAREHARQARDLMASDPANAEHYRWVEPYLDGYLALADRQYPEAIAALTRSDTERPHLALLLAEAYARSRDRASARVWYQSAFDRARGLDVESAITRPQAAAWLERNR